MSTADLRNLETLLERSPHGRDPSAGPLLHRISKDLAERRRSGSADSADAFRTAVTLLPRIGGTVHGEQRITALLDCYRYFYQSGDFPKALTSSIAMHSLSDRMTRLDDVSLAKNLEGIALTELGDVGKALLCYATSLEIAERLGNVSRQSSVLGNTGMALNSIGLYRSAIPCLKKSITIDPTHAMPHGSNLAQSYLELGEFEIGLEALEQGMRCRPEPTDPLTALSRCVCEFTYARLALGVDDLGLARKHSDACLKYSALVPRGAYLAKIVIALCDVRSGKGKVGIRSLLRTLAECEGRLSHEVDCLMALVSAYDECGQPEQALEYLSRLLELIRRNRQNSLQGLVAWSLELEGEMPIQLALQESTLRARAAEKRTQDVTIEMLERLAVTADIREDMSGEHGTRVGTLSRLLAMELGWKHSAALDLERAARLHDIGKIAVPESILRQSTPLQEHAREFLRTHCEAGAEILANSALPSVRLAESIARCHHEAWNGTGYPRGLRGTQIPVGARIVGIVDAFDALTHDRVYGKACGVDETLVSIRTSSGQRFDPDIANAFIVMMDRLVRRFGSLEGVLSAEGKLSQVSMARRRIEMIVGAAT